MEKNQSALNHIIKLVLICIIFIGAFFRFFGLYESIWSSSYDETRDTIVASHFIKYKEFLTRGPNVSTSHLLNPPTYYYFITSLLLLGGSIWGAKLLWAGMLTMTILFAYWLGVLVWDKKLGLISAFLVAVHPTFVLPMQLISQTMLSPILMFILFICLFQRRQTIFSLSCMIWFLLLGLHTHYSIFIVLPFLGILWLILYVSYINTHKLKPLWKKCIPAIVGILGFFIWIFLSYKSFPFDQFSILNIGNTQSLVKYCGQIHIAINEYIYLLYNYFQPNTLMGILMLFCFTGVGILSIYLSKHDIPSKTQYLYAFIVLNILPFVFVGKFPGTIYAPYLLVLVPFGIFTLALILRTLLLKFSQVGVLFIVIVFGFCLRTMVGELKNRSVISYYTVSKKIAEAIYADNALLTYPQKNTYPFTLRVVLKEKTMVLEEWLTGGVWFHLESITKEKLVVLKEIGADFESIEQNPRFTYIICDSRPVDNELGYKNITCELIKSSLQERYKTNLHLIYKNFPYTVWRMNKGV